MMASADPFTLITDDNPLPNLEQCTLRVRDDICGVSGTVKINRSRRAVLKDLRCMAKYLKKSQKLFYLCIHTTSEEIIIHWHTGDAKLQLAKAVVSLGTVPIRLIQCLKEGKILDDVPGTM